MKCESCEQCKRSVKGQMRAPKSGTFLNFAIRKHYDYVSGFIVGQPFNFIVQMQTSIACIVFHILSCTKGVPLFAFRYVSLMQRQNAPILECHTGASIKFSSFGAYFIRCSTFLARIFDHNFEWRKGRKCFYTNVSLEETQPLIIFRLGSLPLQKCIIRE